MFRKFQFIAWQYTRMIVWTIRPKAFLFHFSVHYKNKTRFIICTLDWVQQSKSPNEIPGRRPCRITKTCLGNPTKIFQFPSQYCHLTSTFLCFISWSRIPMEKAKWRENGKHCQNTSASCNGLANSKANRPQRSEAKMDAHCKKIWNDRKTLFIIQFHFIRS